MTLCRELCDPGNKGRACYEDASLRDPINPSALGLLQPGVDKERGLWIGLLRIAGTVLLH